MAQAFDPLAPTLTGLVIESQAQRGVRYSLERLVGAGGMGSAYLAKRDAPEGSSLVVVKVVSPGLGGGEVAPELVALKEAVALGRLNEAVPPTPFVVRFVDAGSAALFGASATPWTAIEYVHGGLEGTTLEDRVTYAVHKTGFAFERARAAHAVRCLAGGLSAIHEVGVIHRDLSPGNVLCCGFGETELFKISDFGIARASGLRRTFHGLMLGTLGYSAPEAALPGASAATDVFSLAALVYYLLTGQHYFEASSPKEAMQKFLAKARPRISDHSALSPELLERPQACAEIDRAIARATAVAPLERPQTAAEFAAGVSPWLGDTHAGPRSSARWRGSLPRSSRSSAASTDNWQWIVKSHGDESRLLTSVAWDTDGHAFALSRDGAHFWNGHSFLDAHRLLSELPGPASLVQRYDAGGWLFGGAGPVLSVSDAGGVRDRVRAPHADTRFDLASGRFDDLFVASGARAGQPPTLFAMSSRRWLKPLPLPEVASIATLQRLDDARWLFGGRLRSGGGFAAIYSPLQFETTLLVVPQMRAIIAGASMAEHSSALLVGSEGVVLGFDNEQQSLATLPGAPDLSAAALDVVNREWVASAGVLWSCEPQAEWRIMWREPSWRAPFVSILADAGIVTAMTVHGAIIEGRSDRARRSERAP